MGTACLGGRTRPCGILSDVPRHRVPEFNGAKSREHSPFGRLSGAICARLTAKSRHALAENFSSVPRR
jgi:hypothetical protein